MKQNVFACLLVLFLLKELQSAQAAAAPDDPTDYSVNTTATVQLSPPSVTLNWTGSVDPATGYTIYRRPQGTTGWSQVYSGSQTVLTFTDTGVTAGNTYEYKLVRAVVHNHYNAGYGYVSVGLATPASTSSRKIVLIVESSISSALARHLAQLYWFSVNVTFWVEV